jgi:hypothetical protein
MSNVLFMIVDETWAGGFDVVNDPIVRFKGVKECSMDDGMPNDASSCMYRQMRGWQQDVEESRQAFCQAFSGRHHLVLANMQVSEGARRVS